MATHTAATASLADVTTAMGLCSDGDTLEIPAGSATWTGTLTVTQCITVKFLGSLITCSAALGIQFAPGAGALASNGLFRLTGGNIGGTGSNVLVYLNWATDGRMDNILIDSNTFHDAADGVYRAAAAGFGVCARNNFVDVKIPFRGIGSNRASWDGYPLAASPFGGADQWFFEDNTISYTADGGWHGFIEGGQGGRYVLRYNTWNLSHLAGFFECMDMHGNQGADGTLYATMIAEVYGNIWQNAFPGRWMYQRGGRVLMFNNLLTGSAGTYYVQLIDEYNDALSPTNGSKIQHPTDSYFWNNFANGASVVLDAVVTNHDGINVAENVDFRGYVSGFDGSVGIGAGVDAPVMSCTAGVGYWRTTHSLAGEPPATMAEMKTYCQGGSFYKSTGSNMWTLYYAPYTYPHPLVTQYVEGAGQKVMVRIV